MAENRRYRVLGTLGRGGFGTVYRAELIGEEGFSKHVALKVLHPEMSAMPEVSSRLRDEARVLGLVRHRAIVDVHGLVRLDGRWTVVMEFVDGIDLGRIIKANEKIPLGPAISIAGEVADALHGAYHQAGPDEQPLHVLHRDIKPSNLRITPRGEVKVLDFGIARGDFETREAKTRSLMFGSIAYLSPERIDNIDGPAGDVYALGAVLYEMLVGEPLGKTSAHPSRHHAKLMRASERVWEVSRREPVMRLVSEMLAYEPDDRPTAREVEQRCADLERICGGTRLRDWAEEIVPQVLAVVDTIDDQELSGSILVERDTNQEVTNTHAWPTMRRQVAAAGVSAALTTVVIILVLAGLGAMWWWSYQQRIAPTNTAPPPMRGPTARVAPDRNPVRETPRAAPVVAPVAKPVAKPEDAPKAEPEAATVAKPEAVPEAKPEAAPELRGRVIVSGDATKVELLRKRRAWAPGEVPEGRYTIRATFEGESPIMAGSVEVRANRQVRINCSSVFRRCRIK